MFTIILPKSWRVERQVTREDDGAVTVTFVASDPSAEQIRLTGNLSDGIRMRFTDRAGRQGILRKQWAQETPCRARSKATTRVKTSDPDKAAWGPLKGVEVAMRGPSAKPTQPELATIFKTSLSLGS